MRSLKKNAPYELILVTHFESSFFKASKLTKPEFQKFDELFGINLGFVVHDKILVKFYCNIIILLM